MIERNSKIILSFCYESNDVADTALPWIFIHLVKNIVLMKTAHKCIILHVTSTGGLFMKLKGTSKSLKPKWEALKVDKQMLKMYGCCYYWSYYQLHAARKLSVFRDKSLYYLYAVQFH